MREIRIILSFYRNIHLTPKICDKEGLRNIVQNYDHFITGSDQVWNNQEINHYDDSYFLAFADNKNTLSYAASFGKTLSMLTAEDKKFYNKCIPLVKHISVREKTASEIVENITGQDAKVVCDRVFLVDKEEWGEYCEIPENERYIFVYFIGSTINFSVNKRIIEIEKGLGVIVSSIGLSSLLYKGCVRPTVEQWLGYIKHADVILTNSFHGTAFSIIFEKTFYSFVRGGETLRMNTRLYDFLEKIGLANQRIDLDDYRGVRNDSIDYTVPREKIKSFIRESKEFLNNALLQ